MKIYGEVEAKAPLFLILSLDGSEWSASRPASLPPGKEPPLSIRSETGWAAAGLDVVEHRKFSCPCRESNPGRPAHNPSIYPLSYPGSAQYEVGYYFGIQLECLKEINCFGDIKNWGDGEDYM
jgi:hypothetical protein